MKRLNAIPSFWLATITPLAAMVCQQGLAAGAVETDATESNQIAEIVVTAQKREERLSDVPLSITAVSGDQLLKQGISSPSDLERVVPGFTFQPTPYGPPVFAIRGVGYYDTALAASPAVTVYVDQVPLPFLAMTQGVSFDLERVEALKGPQGTLFGQNSTGGAINYIAAKPTQHFEAGVNLDYGRFNEANVEAFVSGPLAETLTGRIAVRTEQRDDWQRSYTRDDTLGHRSFVTGRMLLDWKPLDNFKSELNFNAWRDRSDTQAAQFVVYSPTNPVGRPDAIAALQNYPVAPHDIRSADWDPGQSYDRNDRFYQVSLRADYSFTEAIALTSITGYADYRGDVPIDSDGTDYNDLQSTVLGYIHSFTQELRLTGTSGPVRWVAGGNAQLDTTDENQYINSHGTNQSLGPILFDGFENTNHQVIHTYAGFGGIDFSVTDTFALQASARYTTQTRDFAGCVRDQNGELAAGFSFLSTILSGSPTVIAPGACVSLGANGKPVSIYTDSLDQNNVSWRVGGTWKPTTDALVYANATKGYKAGSFGTLPSLSTSQLTPVTQESVMAYETGFKVSLLDRIAQLSGALFYYDYDNKQIEGYIQTGVPFGNLPGLVNVPKSSVIGGELELHIRPITSINATLGVTYVDSKVDKSYLTPDPYGAIVDVKGEQFPNTPRWQFISDVEYTTPINGKISAFVGGDVKYRTSSYAAFGDNSAYDLHAYGVLDARAGIEAPDAHWRAELWGRNVTDKRYFTSVFHSVDTVAAYTGLPATYGISLNYRFR